MADYKRRSMESMKPRPEQELFFDSLPQTGRIGRFIRILKHHTGADVAAEIISDATQYDSLQPSEKSNWWNKTVSKTELRIGTDATIAIMRECGSKCCGAGQRNTARGLYQEAGTMQRFLDKISRHDVKEGDLTYSMTDESTIIAEHHRCFCQQVAHCSKRFETLAYCQCSAEFNRQFFSAAFDKEVDVEIIRSIICGANTCKFKITIL